MAQERICLPVQGGEETWLSSLGQDALEEKMAAHSSIPAWEIPWHTTVHYSCKELDMTEHIQIKCNSGCLLLLLITLRTKAN